MGTSATEGGAYQGLLGLQGQAGNRAVTAALEAAGRRGSPAVAPELRAAVGAARWRGGSPLPPDVRADMAGSLGADFSDVRVHTGPGATRLNDRLHARAFTTGTDVFIRDGEPDVRGAAGRELLAHELSHVVEQRAAGRETVQRCPALGCTDQSCIAGEKCGKASSWSVGSGTNAFQIPQQPFLQGFREDVQNRYGAMQSASDPSAFPHLNQQRMDGEDERRHAQLQQPRDKAALVKQAQDQGRSHKYMTISNRSPSGSTQDLGRIQSSVPWAPREQHFYNTEGSFTPYPAEASHLQSMTGGETSTQDVWQALDSANRGEELPEEFTDQSQSLQSVPTIFNISEAQRSPLMSATSNMVISNQAQTTGTPQSFPQAFGRATKMGGKNINLPGTIPATGSGAVHQFGAVESSLVGGDFSEESVRKNVKRGPSGMGVAKARDYAAQKRNDLIGAFGDRMGMTDVAYAQREGNEESEEATRMRLQSGINRSSLPQMGLMRSGLRPLTTPQGGTSFPTAEEERATSEWFEAELEDVAAMDEDSFDEAVEDPEGHLDLEFDEGDASEEDYGGGAIPDVELREDYLDFRKMDIDSNEI